MNKLKLTALATAAIFAAGCSASVAPDSKGLEYNAGPFSSTAYDNCSTGRVWHGPGDKVFVYPVGQRTYRFGAKKGTDSEAMKVVSKDNLELTVEGVATFSLNDACKVLRKFHEEIGLKYKAHEDEGWADMLDVYIGAPLDRALDQVSKEYSWTDLYSNPEVKKEWETAVGTAVAEQVNATAGDKYFCRPDFSGSGECGSFLLTLQQPVPPENVRTSLAAAQQAIQDDKTQTNRNKQIKTELESMKELVKVLGPDAYVIWKAIQDGKITIVPVPAGSGINVGPAK